MHTLSLLHFRRRAPRTTTHISTPMRRLCRRRASKRWSALLTHARASGSSLACARGWGTSTGKLLFAMLNPITSTPSSGRSPHLMPFSAALANSMAPHAPSTSTSHTTPLLPSNTTSSRSTWITHTTPRTFAKPGPTPYPRTPTHGTMACAVPSLPT